MVSGTFLSYARKLLFSLIVVSLPLAAQTGLGIVRGTVQDASKAVIPSVKVSLTNTATGVVQTSDTNNAGIYYFGNVPIGPYTMSVEAAGFKKWEAKLNLQAGQTLVVDPSMEVGNVESTVEVTGAAPVIATEGGQVSDVKDALRIHDLPLNGRQIGQLFSLTPGVEGGAGNTRTNGMKVGSTEMLLDGISYVDRFGGAMSRVQPGLDTIAEFRIETAGSGAQFSRPATVEMVTRSGSNEIHGAAFETFRNNADGLRARQRQDVVLDPVTNKFVQPKLIRNEYGVWAGGPVIKNKTFWFVDWEGLKQREKNFATTGVATPAMWAGDLSNMTDSNGDPFTIYDPFSTTASGGRTPFVNNVVPQNLFNPVAKLMQSVSPLPSGHNAGGNPWTEYNFETYYPFTQDQHSLTLRGDHNFSSNDTISGRYTNSPRSVNQYGGKYGFPPAGCNNCGGSGRSDVYVNSEYVRYNHVFSPTLLNDVQASAHRSVADYGTLGDKTKWADKLGFPNPFGVGGWPTICTDAYNMFYYGCWDGDNLHNQNLTAFQLEDNVTWIKGKHTIKAGFKGRQEYNNVQELQQAEGSHSFYASWTGLYDPSSDGITSYTGSGFAEMLMGMPTALRNQYNRGYFYFQQKEIGTYVNDTWKISPRLTVDIGLRWDHWTPYHEKYNRLVTLDPTNYVGKFQVITPHNTTIENMPNIPSGVLGSWAQRGMTWVTADSIHFPGALVKDYWKDFGPRAAIAYRITNKMVLRVGYGMYYWPMPLSQILQASRTNPPLNLGFSNHRDNLNGEFFNRSLLINPDPATDIMPNVKVDVTGIQSISSTSRSIFIFDPHNWADDRMQQWTFNLERELMHDTSLRLSYIGNHGNNLEQRFGWNSAQSRWNYQTETGLAAPTNGDLRRPDKEWNGTVESHLGYSNSQSVQAEVQRRFSKGLAFQWFYAYTHAMTTSDEGGFGSGGGGSLAPEGTTVLGNPDLTLSQRLKLVYANSSAVPPHRISWNGIYQLPFGKGKKFASGVSRPAELLVGGWQLAWIGTWQSGNWMGVNSGEYLFGNIVLSKDQRLKMKIFGQDQLLYFRGDFNPSSATNVDAAKLEQLVPADRSQRVLRPLGSKFNNQLPFLLANGKIQQTSITDNLSWNPQNFFLGPGQWNQDISIFKYFNFTERYKLRFTSDFFNFFNHPNNNPPNKTTGLIDLSQQRNDPRIIQFGLRFEW